jgi:hypothetical protein
MMGGRLHGHLLRTEVICIFFCAQFWLYLERQRDMNTSMYNI